jgi:uncharacterized protein YoxC
MSLIIALSVLATVVPVLCVISAYSAEIKKVNKAIEDVQASNGKWGRRAADKLVRFEK